MARKPKEHDVRDAVEDAQNNGPAESPAPPAPAEPASPSAAEEPTRPGKFRCKLCQHEFPSAEKRPACPNGCRYDITRKSKFGDQVTTEAVL